MATPRKERKAFRAATLRLDLVAPTSPEPATKKKVGRMNVTEATKLRLHLESQRQQGSVRYQHVIERLNEL